MDKQIPPPWEWQRKARERASQFPHFALFAEMGTGKTRTMIDILRDKYNTNRRVMRTVIFAPIVVLENWRREILKYSNIDPDRIVVLDGTPTQRTRVWHKAMDKFLGNFIVLVNYDKIIRPDVFAQLAMWKPEIVVLDESHYVKDHTSKRTKAMFKLVDGEYDKRRKTYTRPRVPHRYIMSGTPILNSMKDIWAQYRVLDGGEALGYSYFTFQTRYFFDANAGWKGKQNYFPDWKPLPGAAEQINGLIYQKAVRVTKKECLDLPPLVKKQIFVGMTEEQARLYKEMKKDFVTYIGDKACVADMAMIKAMRLQQIASGYVKLEDGTEIELGNTPRMDALRELLQEITPNHKVLVWAHFKANYRQIRKVCDELKIKYVEVHGDAKEKRQEAIDRFCTDDSVRVFIGNAGSGGIGINLVVASYSIIFSRDFSLAHDEQARSRNHRSGAEIHEKITQIDLVVPGTIDETVLEALNNKTQIAEAVLSWRDRV